MINNRVIFARAKQKLFLHSKDIIPYILYQALYVQDN